MGEGAAAIVLQRAPADGRPAPRSLGRLSAVIQNCDGSHETAPDAGGIGRALRLAHAEAGIDRHDVDLILAHGTGTKLNDDTEARALADFYGDHAAGVMLAGVKAMTGHTAGASGLVSVITGIHIMQEGKIPPQPGLHDPIDAAAAFDVVTEARTGCEVRRIQVDAFGFGGVNAVAILERADEHD
jgi:3-oxoacyl-[acyl-carrier-protein] synthase II